MFKSAIEGAIIRGGNFNRGNTVCILDRLNPSSYRASIFTHDILEAICVCAESAYTPGVPAETESARRASALIESRRFEFEVGVYTLGAKVARPC